MITLNKRSLLGIALCGSMLAVAAPGLAGQVSAAPYAPAISAQLRSHSVLVTGSHFAPGSRVSLALVRAGTLKMLASRTTVAQPDRIACPWPEPGCTLPNTKAGTIRVQMHFKGAAKNLEVMYRTADGIATQTVTDSAPVANPPVCHNQAADCFIP